ncbi:MAG: VWA domain-containing protein [Bryobacteraceae bacterium]|nr:VWA domain-containing protein [Bryobacteraceae bacterium]
MRIAVLLTAGVLLAQDPVIKVDVDLVNILFTVRNKGGGLVGSLEKSDFTILEDGKAQEIRYFTRETDLPLTIGLLVDTSMSQERLIPDERNAASAFFSSVLRSKDMAFLMQFGAEAELLQESTSSTRQLQKALGELRLSVPMGGINPGPAPTASSRAGTILFDAVFLAAEELRKDVGRKAIIIISDGVDTGSKTSRSKAIEAAHKSDAIVYSIYYADPMYQQFGGGDGDLKRMSEDTGGRVFRVDRKTTLTDIFRQIEEEMRSQYSIAYSSTNPTKDGTFRKVELRASNKDFKVQTRKGYYAVENTER